MTALTRRWYRLRLFLAQKVLHTDDSPHAIALGAAVAVFVALLPLVGLQTFISIGIAALLRANKAICIPIVWITNPVTMGPIYYGCYSLGRLLVPASWSNGEEGLARLVELAKTASLFDAGFWKDILTVLAGAGLELWIGAIAAGLFFGGVTYAVVRRLVVGYRERRRQHRLRRALFRPARPQAVARPSGSA